MNYPSGIASMTSGRATRRDIGLAVNPVDDVEFVGPNEGVMEHNCTVSDRERG